MTKNIFGEVFDRANKFPDKRKQQFIGFSVESKEVLLAIRLHPSAQFLQWSVPSIVNELPKIAFSLLGFPARCCGCG